MDNDLKKILTQIEDTLPMVQERINKIEDLSKGLMSITAAAKAITISKKNLEKKIFDKKYAEDTLEMISETILRIDKIFAKETKTKKLKVLRMSYELSQKTLMEHLANINESLGKIAKQKMPKEMKKSVLLFKNMITFYFDDDRTMWSENQLVHIDKNNVIFTHYFEVEGKVISGSKKINVTIYIITSQEYDLEKNQLYKIKRIVLKDKFKAPPYFLYQKGGKAWSSGGVNYDSKFVFGIIQAYGCGTLLESTPDTKAFKLNKRGMTNLKDEDEVFDVKLKGRQLTVFVYQKDFDLKPGVMNRGKHMKLLTTMKNIFPKGRKLTMKQKPLRKVVVKTANGKTNMYKIGVEFFEPGIHRLLDKGQIIKSM